MFNQKIAILFISLVSIVSGFVQDIGDSLETDNVRITNMTEVSANPDYFAGIVDSNIMLVPWDTILGHIGIFPAQYKLVYANPSGGLDTSDIYYDFASKYSVFPGAIWFDNGYPNVIGSLGSYTALQLSGGGNVDRDSGCYIWLGGWNSVSNTLDLVSSYTGRIRFFSEVGTEYLPGDDRLSIEPLTWRGVHVSADSTADDTLVLTGGADNPSAGLHIYDLYVDIKDTLIYKDIKELEIDEDTAWVLIRGEGGKIRYRPYGGFQDTSYRTGDANGILYCGAPFGDKSIWTAQWFFYEDAFGDVKFLGNSFNLRNDFNHGLLSFSTLGSVSKRVWGIYNSGGELTIKYTDSLGADYPTPWVTDTTLAMFKKDSLIVKGYIKAIGDTNTSAACTTFDGATQRATGTAYLSVKDKQVMIQIPGMNGTITASTATTVRFGFVLPAAVVTTYPLLRLVENSTSIVGCAIVSESAGSRTITLRPVSGAYLAAGLGGTAITILSYMCK